MYHCAVWEQSEWEAEPTSSSGITENHVLSGDYIDWLPKKTACRRRHQKHVGGGYASGVGTLALETMLVTSHVAPFSLLPCCMLFYGIDSCISAFLEKSLYLFP